MPRLCRHRLLASRPPLVGRRTKIRMVFESNTRTAGAPLFTGGMALLSVPPTGNRLRSYNPYSPCKGKARSPGSRQAAWGNPELFPKGLLMSVTQLSRTPDQARGIVRFQTQGGFGSASLMCSMVGGSGMFFAIAAPEYEFETRKQELVRILKSFSFSSAKPDGGQAQTGPPDIQFTKFSDPREGAFTVSVPVGWQVDGRTVRFSATDVRYFTQAVSPDGIKVSIGDPNVPPFVVPNETMNWTGFTEGRWYQTTDGTRMMVRRFIPGLPFAREYVSSALARGAAGLEVVDQRERPELAQAVNNINAQAGGGFVQTTLTFGDVSFRFSNNGTPMGGYCLAGTELTSAAGTGVWSVRHLYSFVAPGDKVSMASSVLTRMIQSVEVNPQWFAAQLGTTAAVSKIVTQTNNYISPGPERIVLERATECRSPRPAVFRHDPGSAAR